MTRSVDIRQYQLIKLKKPEDSYVISKYNTYIDRYEFLVDHNLVLDKAINGYNAYITKSSKLFVWTDNIKEARIFYSKEDAEYIFEKLRNCCNTDIEIDSVVDRFNDYTTFYIEEDD